MLVPIITAYGGPAVRSDTLQLIGTGFGRVSSVALVDVSTQDQYECEFIVDRGNSIHLTVPKLLPDGTYIAVCGTLDNTASQNTAGTLVVPDPLPVIPPPPAPPPDPVPDPASPAHVAIRDRLRLELGDFEEGFQASVEGDGFTRRFDLPEEVISNDGLSVVLTPESGSPTTLVEGTDFTMDYRAGRITLTDPPADDAVITITGQHYQFFTDDELALFIRSAALKHTHNSDSLSVYRDLDGFKHYLYADQTVDTLGPVEYHAVALLAATEALEVIQTDAAYDIDVTTAEGTSLPRAERFANIGTLIATKRAIYDDLCNKLGVGLGRVEVFTVRRVSRTTGRLVPVYLPQEYDEVRMPPVRVYSPRNLGATGTAVVQPDPHAFYGSSP